jgi:ureidoglycolate lyase
MREITIMPLTKAEFAQYGEVVEAEGADIISINQGLATRSDNLARVDLADGASPNISLFVAKARAMPINIRLMERHPLASQLFFPLQEKPWLVVVCSNPRDPESFRVYRASGRQGVNYARNVWHHPLLVIGGDQRFVVVDRPGADNLEEVMLEDECCFHVADEAALSVSGHEH